MKKTLQKSTNNSATSDLPDRHPSPKQGQVQSPRNMAPKRGRSISADTIVVGFDTEYQRLSTKTETDGNDKQCIGSNLVLSYQLYALSGKHSWSLIRYPNLAIEERLPLDSLLAELIEKGLREKFILKRPKTVVLAMHYAIADITALDDGKRLIRSLDHVSKGLVTAPGAKPIEVSYYDKHRNKHSLKVIVRDTMLLAPDGGRSLKALGDAIGLEKLEISKDEISQMQIVLEEEPSRFEAYAMRDAQIAAEYLTGISHLSRDFLGTLGVSDTPITVGSMATKLTMKVWKERDIPQSDVLGLRVVRDGKKTYTVPVDERDLYEKIAQKAFAGGRNEAFHFGPSAHGEWSDVDVASAYATCLATIGLPLWKSLRATTDPSDFGLDNIGFAQVEFDFPTSTRFPVLPVRSDKSLIFPLRGVSHASNFEIQQALSLGAKLKISHGCVMPMEKSIYPFAEISSRVRAERNAAIAEQGKGCLREKLIKTIGNSVYGKTAQGIREKHVYNTRTGEMEVLPSGRLTNPYIAAYVTGLLRAVMGEMLNAVPEKYEVLSVTTDGFLTNFPAHELDSLTSGPICAVFKNGLARVSPDAKMLEIKHHATRVISWRTRGQVSLDASQGKPILARAGFQLPRELSQDEQVDLMVTKFIGRRFGDPNVQTRMRSIRDIAENGGDLTDKEVRVRLTMDFDWKRVPEAWGEIPTRDDLMHLWFRTTPVKSLEHYEHIRERWKEFYESFLTPLKTRRDLTDFFDFLAIRKKGKFPLSKGNSSVEVAQKAFLVASKRGLLGLNAQAANRDIAEWLTKGGYRTTVESVENAGRPAAWFSEACVEATPTVLRFLTFVKGRFPEFEAERLLAPPW